MLGIGPLLPAPLIPELKGCFPFLIHLRVYGEGMCKKWPLFATQISKHIFQMCESDRNAYRVSC